MNNQEDDNEYNSYTPGSTSQVMKMFFLVLQIGITMLVTIFLCIGLGYLVDRWFGTRLMVWFILLGVISGFRSVYVLIRRFIGHDGKS